MTSVSTEHLQQTIAEIYQAQSRRVFATLVRLVRDFDLAEEALHEAFAAALEQWPREGLPDNPRAWLVSAGRFKAIDIIRRRTKRNDLLPDIAKRMDAAAAQNAARADQEIEDDRLRLIFTCCHPALDPHVQVALTLREVCGLTTDEIARAFLTAPATMAQRLVRGKAKIRDAGIPFEVPGANELADRLESVLQVAYLVFNEGYAASSGDSVTRGDLSAEAIRLTRLLVELLPAPEAQGMLALMLLQESRREARATPEGDIVLLEAQDRARWNREQIAEGKELLAKAIASRRFGAYSIQAAIAATHADAPSAAETNWAQIVSLYDVLVRLQPSPVVALNRAVAIAMRDGPESGIKLIDEILSEDNLADYHLAHAARADLCRRANRFAEARTSYQAALALVKQEPERRFLEQRLREVS